MLNSTELTKVLNSGGVAVVPTDTIYGLVACAFNESAVTKIYAVKKRAMNKPSIVLIADFGQLADFGIEDKWLNETKKYWPGPNSLIIPSHRTDKYLIMDGAVALRLPSNKQLRQLIRQTGPLIAPSANPEGLPPATTIDEAKAYFRGQVDIYIDGGKIIHQPSTIINLVSHQTLR